MAKAFDYSLDFKHTDFRAHPELYAIGKGEQFRAQVNASWRRRKSATGGL